MSITADRMPHIEFLAVTLSVSFAFIFRAPPLSYVSNIYFLPFNGVVWICAIILIIIGTILVFVVHKFSKEESSNLTASDFVMHGITTVCQMGSPVVPTTTAGKLTTVKLPLFTSYRFSCSISFVFSSSFFV